jgi:hypothetical protein
MTPKEKALELVDKFASPLDVFKININSKRCSLIAVDEILNKYNDFIQTHEQFLYWQEVKQKIEKL